VRRVCAGRPLQPDIVDRRFVTLTPADVDLGFAGRRGGDDALHRSVAALCTGQMVRLRDENGRVLLVDAAGRVVGALSSTARERWRGRLADVIEARVFAVLRRDRSLSADAFRDSVRTDTWEVPLVEMVTLGGSFGPTER
jgi:ATP-dependent DNA helicase RecQ